MWQASREVSNLWPSSVRRITDEVMRALVMASAGHQGQQYASGVDYAHHLLGAAAGAGAMVLELGESHGWGAPLLEPVVVAAITHDLGEDSYRRTGHQVDLTRLIESGTKLVPALAVMILTRRPGQSKADYWQQLAHPGIETIMGVSRRDRYVGSRILAQLGEAAAEDVLSLAAPMARLVKIAGDTAFNANLWKIELLYEIDLDDYVRNSVGEREWNAMSPENRAVERARLTPDFEESIRLRQASYCKGLELLSSQGVSVFGCRDLAAELIASQRLDIPWTRAAGRDAPHPGPLSGGIESAVATLGLEGLGRSAS